MKKWLWQWGRSGTGRSGEEDALSEVSFLSLHECCFFIVSTLCPSSHLRYALRRNYGDGCSVITSVGMWVVGVKRMCASRCACWWNLRCNATLLQCYSSPNTIPLDENEKYFIFIYYI
ncbi:MAG: hypothetical protein IJP82_02935, partial [Bacteroidaceae bacterium]|nr:hypothetical protein [Bacteroidaceae bacterium]